MEICAHKDQPNKFFSGIRSEKKYSLALGSLLGSTVRVLGEREKKVDQS